MTVGPVRQYLGIAYTEPLLESRYPIWDGNLIKDLLLRKNCMPSHKDIYLIVAKYLERPGEVARGRTCIIITKDDMVV